MPERARSIASQGILDGVIREIAVIAKQPGIVIYRIGAAVPVALLSKARTAGVFES
jgi:hypothetical protein